MEQCRPQRVPQVPYPGHAVLASRVHPAAIFVKPNGGDVLAYAIVINDWVGVVRVQVVHPNVLVTWKPE